MGLLQPLTKDIGYFKSGWQGSTGSGKSTTAALVAIGIHRHLKLTSPVAFYDSERGSGFLKDLFELAKIKMVGVRSRNLIDLSKFMIECEESKIDIAIVDSITHPWRELLDTWREKRGYIRMDDWGAIKKTWADSYTSRFLNSRMHILMCGREQYVYEDVEDDRATPDGKKRWKPVKIGTKMATEGETGYEPNFLVELEKRLMNEGASFARYMNVIKDRSFRLDGMEVELKMPMKNGKPDVVRLVEENVPFEFVKAHIEALDPAAGAVAVGVNVGASSELFNDDGEVKFQRDHQEREILLGNIEALLHKYFPSKDKLSLKAKNDILEATTWAIKRRIRNWDAITKRYKLDEIRVIYSLIDQLLAPGNRSRLEKALESGIEGGEIHNPDWAPEQVKNLCLELMAHTEEKT